MIILPCIQIEKIKNIGLYFNWHTICTELKPLGSKND